MFWEIERRWERDTRDHVFLPRAILAIGKAMYGPKWSGTEQCLLVPFSFNALPLAARRDERRMAHELLAASGFPYEPKPIMMMMLGSINAPGPKPSSYIRDYEFTAEEWKKARELREIQIAPEMAPFLRFAATKAEFISEATMGKLATFTREKQGVRMQELNPDVWALVNPGNIFAECLINPSKPRSIAFAGDAFLPIFVSRSSLEAWTQARASAAHPGDVSSKGSGAVRDAEVGDLGVVKKSVSESLNAGNAASEQPIIGTPEYMKLSRAFRRLDAKKYYAERVKQWAGSTKGPAEVEETDWFKTKFGLGRADTRSIRADLAPEAWKLPGGKEGR